MPPTERESAQEALSQLLEQLEITRVVCVDDVYALESNYEDAAGLIEVLGEQRAREVLGDIKIPLDQAYDIWIEPFRQWWETLRAPRRRLLHQALENLEGGAEARTNEQDLKVANALPEFFANQEFVPLSLTQWQVDGERYLQEAENTKTLFLFDEDLRNDGGTKEGGRELIKHALGATAGCLAMYGLLSHNIPADGDFEIWKKFKSEAYGFDSDRVVPVSKHTLEASPLRFALAIKMTVLNPYCHALAEVSAKLMRRAHKKARVELEQINIYLFERLVFEVSNREGIWEPDMLFRLHNLFQRNEARSLATKSRKLRQLADQIRKVSAIPTADGVNDNQVDSWTIQRLELYQDAGFLNASFLPIELGDIFELTKGKRPKYILLAQPCDLMVRTKTGNRKKTVTHVVLARITTREPEISQLAYHYELPYFDSNTGKSAYVNFTDTHLVSLRMLDLCAFNANGLATMKLRDRPKNLILAWRKHHQHALDFFRTILESQAQVQKTISSFNERTRPEKQISPNILNSLIPEFSSPPLFTLSIDTPAKAVSFDCKRVRRFEANHAADMWTKYSNFASRAAFDVDLA